MKAVRQKSTFRKTWKVPEPLPSEYLSASQMFEQPLGKTAEEILRNIAIGKQHREMAEGHRTNLRYGIR